MDAQDGFKNRQVADMTPNQARDRLTDLALEVLEAANQVQGPKSKIYGELRAQLDVQGASKEGDNKGSTAFELMKHSSGSASRRCREADGQSRLAGRTRSISL